MIGAIFAPVTFGVVDWVAIAIASSLVGVAGAVSMARRRRWRSGVTNGFGRKRAVGWKDGRRAQSNRPPHSPPPSVPPSLGCLDVFFSSSMRMRRTELLLPNTSPASLGCQSGTCRRLPLSPTIRSSRRYATSALPLTPSSFPPSLPCCVAAAALHFMVPGNINKCNLLIPLATSPSAELFSSPTPTNGAHRPRT